MIRHRHGCEFFLFTQHHHALVSGELAGRIDGGPVDRPSPATLQAIALHDSGWPLHDDDPTLNADGEPLHVFETPAKIGTRVWSASSDRAAALDPYSGLLVSLHGLHLSLMAQNVQGGAHDVFDLNKFQHAQIELQEKLRPQLGLRVDRALLHGLAEPGESPEEEALRFDFRLLRAMDALSLSLLCSDEMRESRETLPSISGRPPVEINIKRLHDFTVIVKPWLFVAGPVELPIAFRRVRAGRFERAQEFRDAYASAPVETMVLRVVS